VAGRKYCFRESYGKEFDQFMKQKLSVEITPKVIQNLHMTFSKKSKIKHLLPKANQIIERLKNEGIIEKWIQEYLNYYETKHNKKD